MIKPNSLFQKENIQAKMILLDLDGTLIGKSGQLEDTLHNALAALRARRPDLHLIVNTGRPFGGIAAEVARRLGSPDTPHIFHGGALTRSAREVILAEAIDPAHIHALLDQHEDHPDFALELYSAEEIFVTQQGPLDAAHGHVLGMSHTFTDLRALADSTPLIKAQWILPATQIDVLRPSYLDACVYAEATSDVMPEAAFVTITRQGVDKGSATRALLASMSMDPDDVIAIGDSSGDIPMLDVVGFPFIMRNAPESLHSRYPTLPHIEEEGIIPLLDALR